MRRASTIRRQMRRCGEKGFACSAAAPCPLKALPHPAKRSWAVSGAGWLPRSIVGRHNRPLVDGDSGIEGHEKPQQFVITVDGVQVFSAPVGGKGDHELNAADPNKAAAVLDERLTRRLTVTAGPHDLGFTWIEKRTLD